MTDPLQVVLDVKSTRITAVIDNSGYTKKTAS